MESRSVTVSGIALTAHTRKTVTHGLVDGLGRAKTPDFVNFAVQLSDDDNVLAADITVGYVSLGSTSAVIKAGVACTVDATFGYYFGHDPSDNAIS